MEDTPDILKKILARKVEEIDARNRAVSLDELSRRVSDADAPRGFLSAMHGRVDSGQPAVIAEIKKASPSRGVLREDFVPAQIAESYERGGAACLSVLTDIDFFQGADAYLQQARAACSLPVLRKDFIIDPYQVYEARVIGADCILLIVAALGDAMLTELLQLAEHLQMDCLTEVHDKDDLEKALACGADIIGINNRDLDSFKVDIDTTFALAPLVPKNRILVSESGIEGGGDIPALKSAGVHAVLVGSALMKNNDPAAKTLEIVKAGEVVMRQ